MPRKPSSHSQNNFSLFRGIKAAFGSEDADTFLGDLHPAVYWQFGLPPYISTAAE